MKTTLRALLLLPLAVLTAGLGGAAMAQEPAAPAASMAPKAAFKLQHRSAFTPPAGPRKDNPFWPIGWTPSPDAPLAGPVAEAPMVTENNFTLSSVLLGAAPQLAIINGREYAVGDQVPAAGSAAAKAQLVAIRDGQAVLRYNRRDLVVELKIR